MKKILTSLLLTVALLATVVCPAFVSADSDDWVLGPEAKYLTHGDKMYYPMEFPRFSYLNYGEFWDTHNLEFADKQDEQTYDSAYVDVIPQVKDIIVEVTLYDELKYNSFECIYYVEEAYQEEFLKIKDGVSSYYCTENDYGVSTVFIDAATYNTWKQGSVVEMTAADMEHYDLHYLYACDKSDAFRHECGIILRGADGFYLLDYNEYDRTYFYADGEFATDHDGAVKLYTLEDDALLQKLIDCYDALPEEELDWLVPTEPSESTTTVVSVIFFGVLPGALMVLAVILLIVVKDRQYRMPLIVLLCSAATVLISYIVVCSYM